MPISLIPLITLFIINVVVAGYVLRLRDHSRSGFFLIVNALALIIWAAGSVLFQTIGDTVPVALALPFLSALLVPANFLYFAMTRPRPLRESWQGNLPLFVIFLPAFCFVLLLDYTPEMGKFFDYSSRADAIPIYNSVIRASALYAIICIAGAISVFAVRYHSGTGTDQIVAKHLIVAIIGPLFFAMFFWASSRQGGPSVVPSPVILFVLMAQIGLIAVLRQEDIASPRFLSRVVYNLTAVLVAFLIVGLMSEFYVFAIGRFVMDRTVGWLVLGATLILVLVARFSRVESALDRLLFTRAAEYRRLVDETQQELREARERLRRSERLSVVGELAARVAHEIKNPLGPIKGYTQMMREKLEDDTEFRHREAFLRHLEVIAEEVESIDRRVRQFLDSARQTQILVEPTDINKIVDRCGRLLMLEVAGSIEPLSGIGVNVEVQLDPNVGEIMADPGRVEEAVFNVARNALDAIGMERGGTIWLATACTMDTNQEPGIQIVVQDTGEGFDVSKSELLFSPFYTEKPEGTGLGLAIVKSAVEAHGGSVILHNRPGGGGEVVIWLPREAKTNPGALLPRGGGA